MELTIQESCIVLFHTNFEVVKTTCCCFAEIVLNKNNIADIKIIVRTVPPLLKKKKSQTSERKSSLFSFTCKEISELAIFFHLKSLCETGLRMIA